MTKIKILSLYRHFTEEMQRETLCCKLKPGSYVFELIPHIESNEELYKAVSDADVILSVPMSPYIDRQFLETANKLKLIKFFY